MRVIVVQDDGTEVDVTESVRVTYDSIRQSMDWGSDFLDLEEIEQILALARVCQFPDLESAELSVQYRRERDARRAQQMRDWTSKP